MTWAVAAPYVVAGTMAAMGYLQGKQQQKQAKAQMLARAAEQRYSPWTGQAAQTPFAARPSALGPTMQGGLSGMMLAQNIQSAQQNDAFKKKYSSYLDRKMASDYPIQGKASNISMAGQGQNMPPGGGGRPMSPYGQTNYRQGSRPMSAWN